MLVLTLLEIPLLEPEDRVLDCRPKWYCASPAPEPVDDRGLKSVVNQGRHWGVLHSVVAPTCKAPWAYSTDALEGGGLRAGWQERVGRRSGWVGKTVRGSYCQLQRERTGRLETRPTEGGDSPSPRFGYMLGLHNTALARHLLLLKFKGPRGPSSQSTGQTTLPGHAAQTKLPMARGVMADPSTQHQVPYGASHRRTPTGFRGRFSD